MCTIDFICEWWPVISLSGLIIGAWVGALTVFLILRSVKQNNNNEKDKKISDLTYTKDQLLKVIRDQDEALELKNIELEKRNK